MPVNAPKLIYARINVEAVSVGTKIELEELLSILRQLKDEFHSEAIQSIWRKDHAQGMAALGGMYFIERLWNDIVSKLGAQGIPYQTRTLRGKKA